MSEEDTRRAIEIYRQEHETWNVEQLMSVFADDVALSSGTEPPIKGKAAVRAWVGRRAANPNKRRMRHLREFVQGSWAAVEWEVDHLGDDGQWHLYRFGVNIFEVVDGKIRLLRLYGFPARGVAHR